jgi:hypothetical protein
MNGRHTAAFAFAAYVVLSFLSAPAAFAQTGAAATKQMQDTQRKAQQKAREAKSNPRPASDTQNDKKATPASDVQ